ncbi:DUF2132 domain-containing protein [bacterium]|nr:DUF2132 domain-containing protein [bacterium]
MPKTPHQILDGVTLKKLLTELVDAYGWNRLAKSITIRCFMFEPSITSSLRFLRKNPWARQQVEALYVTFKQSSD